MWHVAMGGAPPVIARWKNNSHPLLLQHLFFSIGVPVPLRTMETTDSVA